MTFVDDLTDLMPHTVQVKLLTGRDADAKPTYGAATSFAARVSGAQRWITRADGSEVLSRGRVWIAGTPIMTPDDRLVLPDGSTPPILDVETFADEDGNDHVRVTFG